MKLLTADETVSNSKEDYDMLKQYSGSKRVQVNKKYQIPYDVINNMNIVMMSNAAFPIAAAKEEKPTSESNNQFFVYEFKAFAGTIDPKLDQKLEDRIGYYVRTELKSVFDGLDFTGNRYSIKTPITPEEIGLFEGSITEEESTVESLIDAIGDKASVPQFNEGHRKLMETGWIPTELIKDCASLIHVSLQAMVKQLQEQGYLVMAESKKQTVKGSGERMRCQQMTDKLVQEIKFYEPKP